MVARLPQQVLLLLVLVSGTSAETTREPEEPRWVTYSTRRTSRSFRWSFSSLEHSTRETRLDRKIPETTPWSVDRSSSGTRLALGFLEAVTERSSEEDEEARMSRDRTAPSAAGNGALSTGLPYHKSFASTFNRNPGNAVEESNPSVVPISVYGERRYATQSTNALPSRKFIDMTPTRPSIFVVSSSSLLSGKSLKNITSTTPTSREIEVPRRQMRQVSDACEKFQVGDETKREFYSPNYPDPYPNLTECIRVLEADKGMLLKLDFRDEFKLEDSPDCRFDFLEVRDGQHGYSNLLGNFCGTNFPPEITSKTRYLWLRFRSDENIEGKGFKAVWTMVPRPTYPGVPPEPEPCIVNVTGVQAIIQSSDVEDRKKFAEKEGIALDCMWIIKVNEGWKIQLMFGHDTFKLQRPNECDANFVDIFNDRTDMPSREKNFCGSIADTVMVKNNIAHIRFYAEPKALNSSFEAVMTAIREKETGEKSCYENEYDCEDATCIASELRCNGKVNCRFRWDEDEQMCGTDKSRLIDSQHIVIILVVFSLIMFGMSFAFVFNCVRKLIRDHRIIQEHIRQSRENRLDELGRKSTPRPVSASRTDIRDRGSESPSLEVVPSKELLPPTTLIAQEYAKDLVLEMAYNSKDINDIHQSNNMSNATQERLQESNDEPEMRDNSCQTRESLFESRMPVTPAGFTTFGVRGSQNGTNHHHHHHRYYHHHHQASPQSQKGSQQPSQQSSQSSQETSQQNSQCSGCSPASRGRDGSMGVCPKHNPIPAPPGWSTHEMSYPLPVHPSPQYPEPLDYPAYHRFPQSPKPNREGSVYARQSPKFSRQTTVGSGERYGSIYGSGGHGSNATSSSQHSGTPKQQATDPRYRAEAVIEVDQRRPFSIESTKSAPDVIATH